MNELLNKIRAWYEVLGDVGPWLFAVIIIVVGYLAAKVIQGVLRKGLNRVSLDDKIAGVLGQDADGCEKAIASFVFWLVMLVVAVLALSVAGQEETVAPLRDIYDKILGFIPNLVAAVVLAFIAWIIATVLKNLLVGLLSASRVDERVGLGEAKPITNSVGLVVFFGIILMMLPNVLSALKMDEISRPIASMVAQIFDYVPKLFAGIVLFTIGYLVASIVQKVLVGLLSSIGADDLPARLGFSGDGLVGGKTLSQIVSYTAMATILVLIGAEAIELMGFQFLTDLARDFVPGYFNILGALIIIAIAFFVANIVGQLIEPRSAFWARVVRLSIIIFFGAVALQRANISELTNDIFQLIITSLVIAAAFAAGVGGAIALGLGGRDKARAWLEKIR